MTNWGYREKQWKGKHSQLKHDRIPKGERKVDEGQDQLLNTEEVKTDWWRKWVWYRQGDCWISQPWKRKVFPSVFYSNWKTATDWSAGINNSRWRLSEQTNAFPLGGWSLKPVLAASWEVGQNRTVRLMRRDVEWGAGMEPRLQL